MKKTIAIKTSIITRIIVLVAIVFSCLFPFWQTENRIAVADEHGYGSVMYDLYNDRNFNPNEYPSYTYDEIQELNTDSDSTNDVPLFSIFQIGEGDKNLYLYVYQPTHNTLDLVGSSIEMYYGFSPNGEFPDGEIKSYDIELVSTYGVFDKYKVINFEVKGNEEDRYYNIISISRKPNLTIDSNLEVDGTELAEVAHNVGQQWYIKTVNNSTVVEMNTFLTVDIDVKACGNIRFKDGFSLNTIVNGDTALDVWFVAFDVTNFDVKYIFDADVSFRERKYDQYITKDPVGDWSEEIIVTLHDNEELTYEGRGLFGREFKWQQIMSATDFKSNFENQGGVLTGTTSEKLTSAQWVFAFHQTRWQEYTKHNEVSGAPVGTGIKGTELSEVSVIRIHFMDIHDDVYNLGVVSDKYSPDILPDGVANSIDIRFPDLPDLEIILIILFLIIGLLILAAVLPIVFKVLSYVLKIVFAPFKALFGGKSKSQSYSRKRR